MTHKPASKRSRQRTKDYNGKPMEHWVRESKKLVVAHLVQGSFQYSDKNNFHREMASKELMGLALQIDRFLVATIIEERDNFQSGAAMALASLLLPDKEYYKLRRAAVRGKGRRDKRLKRRSKVRDGKG